MQLTEVTPADWAEAVTAVHEAAASAAYAHLFSTPFPRTEVLARWRAHPGRTVLALEDDAVIGFAASEPGTLEGLYVLPEHAGHGVGTRLLRAIAPVDRLWVLEGNTAGRAFYERRGWRWSGVRQAAPDADGLPELLYVIASHATRSAGTDHPSTAGGHA